MKVKVLCNCNFKIVLQFYVLLVAKCAQLANLIACCYHGQERFNLVIKEVMLFKINMQTSFLDSSHSADLIGAFQEIYCIA